VNHEEEKGRAAVGRICRKGRFEAGMLTRPAVHEAKAEARNAQLALLTSLLQTFLFLFLNK